MLFLHRFSIALLALLSPTFALGGAKSIERTIPRFGQRGTTVEVEIQGISLLNPREIIFYKPGIRAYDFKIAEVQPSRRGFAHGGYLDMAITCKFEIAPDCEPGQHVFRLLTATELTHIGTFHVTPFRTIPETKEPKASKETAMPVSLNTTVNGELQNEPEYFRVPVSKGQQLSVELDSVRISDLHYGDSQFDLKARILNAAGKEVAVNDDNALHQQDPVLSAKIDFDGDAFVVIERSVAQPFTSIYSLHIGSNRRPLVAFPPGGKAGEKQSFRMIGDALGDFETSLEVPKESGNFSYFGDAPSPVNLRSTSFPNVNESDEAAETSVSQIPIALNGIIDRFDDKDRFRFTAKKDEALHIRVFAAALGSPIDPTITIFDANGKAVLESDDSKLEDRDIFGTSYRGGGGRSDILDPSVMWTPETDGDYVIELSDTSGAGGPTGVYRIEIEKPRPVFQTVLWSSTTDWTESTRNTGLAVPRGGRNTVNITLPVGQWQPLETEFDIVARGLPEGVRLVSPRVKSSKERHGRPIWPVQFIAEPDAKIGGALITLEAKPVDASVEVENRCQENVPFLNHSGGNSMNFAQVDQYILGVTDPAPFSIDIIQPAAALVRGGELTVPVKITRKPGFEGAIEYWVRFVDIAISYQPPTTIPPGETESLLRLSASAQAALGRQPLAVIARSLEGEIPRSLGVGDLKASSEIVTITVAEPYVELTSQPESIRRGENKAFIWKVAHKTPFEGKAIVNLLGLPKGVTLVGDPPKMTVSTNEITFQLTATDEALLGQATGLGCEVVVTVSGQEVTQRTGKGSLRIDPRLGGDSN